MTPSTSPPPASAAALVDAEAGTRPAPVATPVRGRLASWLLGIGLVLVALNLRPLFSSLSPVLPEIMVGLSISPAVASLMTTLPVLCLGLFAPTAPVLAQRFGAERTILVLLVLIALGTALRGLATLPALLAGSALAGAGIAVVNVLLPGLIKRDFPRLTGLMTGLYTTAICAGGAAGAGLTVPLESHVAGGWPGALALWAVPTIVVALLWLPQAIAAGPALPGVRLGMGALWRDPLAWQVTLVMGLQSAMAYCVFGWLAPLLRERGLDAATAGYAVSATIAAQMVACLLVPSIAVRQRDQRAIGILIVAAAALGFIAVATGPLAGLWVFVAIQGLGQGGALAIAMMLIILRAPDSRVAAHLSGMAQSVGYTLAAVGPLLIGLIRQWTGGFGATIWLFGAIGLGCAAAMLGAGRRKHVLTGTEGGATEPG
jgi:CP family cyanate transporter-like MFS transporter